MALDRLKIIPNFITAGTTIRLDLDFDQLPASDGGSIEIFMRGPGTVPASDFTYGTDGDSFTVDITAAATNLWAPGIYEYTIKHTDITGSPVELVSRGRTEILSDPTSESKKDARTYNEKMVSNLQEIAIEIAKNPYKTLQMGDILYSGHNISDLKKIIDEYTHDLELEKLADTNKQGGNTQYDVSFELSDL